MKSLKITTKEKKWFLKRYLEDYTDFDKETIKYFLKHVTDIEIPNEFIYLGEDITAIKFKIKTKLPKSFKNWVGSTGDAS